MSLPMVPGAAEGPEELYQDRQQWPSTESGSIGDLRDARSATGIMDDYSGEPGICLAWKMMVERSLGIHASKTIARNKC